MEAVYSGGGLPLVREICDDADFFTSSGLDPCRHVILIVTEVLRLLKRDDIDALT